MPVRARVPTVAIVGTPEMPVTATKAAGCEKLMVMVRLFPLPAALVTVAPI